MQKKEPIKNEKREYSSSSLISKNVYSREGGLRTKRIIKKSVKDKPLISIVTVVFNEANLLEETIKSIINQSDDNIEYIIIDGGSTDSTLDIIQKYEAKIDYWISEKDNGIYDAMNKAIKLATGIWITNINCGDKLLHIPINDLKLAIKGNYDALCGRVLTEEKNARIPKFNWTIYLHNTLPHQGLYYKKESIYSAYELGYKIFSDFAYNIGMYKKKQKVYLSTQILAFHSIIGASNNINNKNELFRVVYDKGGLLKLVLSYLYFKRMGFLQRFKI